MRDSIFRIIPLDTAVAEAARRALAIGACDHALVTVDSPTGYPCRHCLGWAKPGDRVILFPFESVTAGHPYSESGPIFVHEKRCEKYTETDRFPTDLRKGRVLRAYDAQQNMIDAFILNDDVPEAVVEKLLGNPMTAFLQARSADRGCFTMRIERA